MMQHQLELVNGQLTKEAITKFAGHTALILLFTFICSKFIEADRAFIFFGLVFGYISMMVGKALFAQAETAKAALAECQDVLEKVGEKALELKETNKEQLQALAEWEERMSKVEQEKTLLTKQLEQGKVRLQQAHQKLEQAQSEVFNFKEGWHEDQRQLEQAKTLLAQTDSKLERANKQGYLAGRSDEQALHKHTRSLAHLQDQDKKQRVEAEIKRLEHLLNDAKAANASD